MIKHLKLQNKSIPELIKTLCLNRDPKVIIRFCVACVEDIKAHLMPSKDNRIKFVNKCIQFYEYYLLDKHPNPEGVTPFKDGVLLYSFDDLTKDIESLLKEKWPIGKIAIYLTLAIIIYENNNIYSTANGTVSLDKRVKSFVDLIIERRLEMGGVSIEDCRKFYQKLLNAFLSESEYKMPIENLKDPVDVLILIDILQDNNIPIIENGFIVKGRINLPYYFNIKAEEETIRNNFWIKQWLLHLFSH